VPAQERPPWGGAGMTAKAAAQIMPELNAEVASCNTTKHIDSTNIVPPE